MGAVLVLFACHAFGIVDLLVADVFDLPCLIPDTGTDTAFQFLSTAGCAYKVPGACFDFEGTGPQILGNINAPVCWTIDNEYLS